MRRIARGIAFVLLGIPILFGIILLATMGYLRTHAGRARLRAFVIARVRSSVPGFDFAQLGGDLTRTIVLENVRVRDAQGRDAIAAERIAVRYHLPSLFSHTLRLEEVRVTRPSIMAVTDPSGHSNLGELTRPSPKSEGAPWTLDLRNGIVENGTASFTRENGQNISISRLDLEGSARLDASLVEVTLDRLEIVGLTPAGSVVVSGSAAGPRSQLALDMNFALPERGRARVTGTIAPDRPSYHLELAVDDVDPHALQAALPKGRVHLQAELDGRNWRVESLDAEVAGIRVRAHGHGSPRAIALELDARTAGPLPLAKARGHIDLHARIGGALPDRLEIHARGQGRNLVLGDRRVGQFALHADASNVPRRPRGRVRVSARGIAPGRGQPPIDRIELSAFGDGTNFQVRASGSGAQVQGDLAMHGRLAERAMEISIDRLAARMPDQSAQLTHPTAIHVRRGRSIAIDETRIHLAGRKLQGDVSARGMYRIGATPHIEAVLSLRRGSLAGLDPVELDARAEVAKASAHVTADARVGPHHAPVHVEATLPVRMSPKGPPRLASRGRVAGRAFARGVVLRDLPGVRPDIKDGLVDLDVSVDGTFDNPTLRAETRLHRLRYRSLPTLDASATLASGPGHTAVSAHATLRAQPLLDLRGDSDVSPAQLARRELPLDRPFHLTIHMPHLDLAELRGVSDRLADYAGIGRADAELSGTLRHPRGSVHGTVAGARIDTVAFGPINANAAFDDRTARAEVAINQVGGGQFDLSASYDRASRIGRAHLRSSHARIEFARSMLPRMRDLGGVLDGDVEIRGTPETPTFTGRLSLSEGLIGLVGQPTFRDVQVDLALSPGHLEIQRLHAKSNGSLDAHGSADLAGLRLLALTLAAKANGFVVALGGTSGRLDGSFAIQAARRDEVLAGHVQVPEATLWLPQIAGGRKLQSTRPHPDLKFIDPAGRAETGKAAEERQNVAGRIEQVQLQANAPTVFVRSRDVNLEVEAQTEVKTDPQGRPIVTGVISVRRGSITINQQKFEIDHARIMFNGSPELDPGLDIELRHQFDQYTAVIRLRGTRSKPELTFESDPPGLDPSQVVGMIMGGGPLGGDPSQANLNVSGAIATAILGKLADQIAPQLGIDVLRVSSGDGTTAAAPFSGTPSTTAGTRIEVGKYVSPRILLSFVHVVGATEKANQNEARVEYRISRRWVVETAFGDAGAGAVDFLWTRRY